MGILRVLEREGGVLVLGWGRGGEGGGRGGCVDGWIDGWMFGLVSFEVGFFFLLLSMGVSRFAIAVVVVGIVGVIRWVGGVLNWISHGEFGVGERGEGRGE